MTGITGYGICLPYYRIKREIIFQAMGWFNPGLSAMAAGEKTVASHDEDSLTMAVSAGLDCIQDIDRSQVGTFLLASTTLPYKERSNVAIAASAAEKHIESDTGIVTCDISAVDQRLDVKVRGTFKISVPLVNG